MSIFISNMDDVIDSRDVIARIEELREICPPFPDCETGEEELDPAYTEDERAEAPGELEALERLAEQASGCADWEYGEQLIRGSYFKEYAQELAEEGGMLNRPLCWPYNCIDWEQAARELQMDYTAVDFDGIDYWIRF